MEEQLRAELPDLPAGGDLASGNVVAAAGRDHQHRTRAFTHHHLWRVTPAGLGAAAGRLATTIAHTHPPVTSVATLRTVRNQSEPPCSPHLAPDARVHTAVLCRNAGAAAGPDLWVWDVDDWVVLPWEPQPPHQLDSQPLSDPTRVRTR